MATSKVLIDHVNLRNLFATFRAVLLVSIQFANEWTVANLSYALLLSGQSWHSKNLAHHHCTVDTLYLTCAWKIDITLKKMKSKALKISLSARCHWFIIEVRHFTFI